DTALSNYGIFKQAQNILFKSSAPDFTNVFNFGTYELAGGNLRRPSPDLGAAAPETTFHNYGTFKKTAFGDSAVFLEFSNHLGGLVSVEQGAATLRFASGGIQEGSFAVPASSTISFERWVILPVERAINTIKPTCVLLGEGTCELQRGSQFQVQ